MQRRGRGAPVAPGVGVAPATRQGGSSRPAPPGSSPCSTPSRRSLHLNGRLTLGENPADFGGPTIAHYAFQQTPRARAEQRVGGFTPSQRFFLAYAHFLAATIRPETLRQQVPTAPHTPNEFRVIGTLLNTPEFQQAFGCQLTEPMGHPAAGQARIW